MASLGHNVLILILTQIHVNAGFKIEPIFIPALANQSKYNKDVQTGHRELLQ